MRLLISHSLNSPFFTCKQKAIWEENLEVCHTSLSFKAPIELMQLLVISLLSAVDLVSFLEIFGKKEEIMLLTVRCLTGLFCWYLTFLEIFPKTHHFRAYHFIKRLIWLDSYNGGILFTTWPVWPASSNKWKGLLGLRLATRRLCMTVTSLSKRQLKFSVIVQPFSWNL